MARSTEFETVVNINDNEVDVMVYGSYQPKEPNNGVQEEATIDEVRAIFGIGKDQKCIDVPLSLFGMKTLEEWKNSVIERNRNIKQSRVYGF
jgi:hypothetical protein